GCYGPRSSVTLTHYWIPVEGTVDDRGLLTGPLDTPLNECVTNRTIKMVAKETYRKAHLEGTLKLTTAQVVNLGPSRDPKNNPCFIELGDDAPYGLGSSPDRPLVPW
ncbi:hypothetical protein DFJ74DRAFT_590647, partial [Hyaloraphidium curvatum]